MFLREQGSILPKASGNKPITSGNKLRRARLVQTQTMAVCGRFFTLAVNEHGDLFSWGRGEDGQLGLGARRRQQQPARVGGVELFDNQRIRLIAAGLRHQVVVLENGTVYTCGFGAYGQLGHGDAQSRRWLTRVPQEAFAGAHVIQVACGNLHTMAVTAEGHAWTCGLNYSGQLGVGGDRTRSFTFTKVDLGGARIAMAACGMHHSVVMSAEGRVWTWGCGQDGCLGHDDEQDMLVPRCCEGLHESTIVMVAAGGNHTAALGECGSLWAWGDGSQGQLGLGNIEDRLVPTRVGAEEAFGGSKARMVACGGARTLVLTVSGELWVCGEGANGRLGLNDTVPRLVPTRVDQKHFAGERIAAVDGDSYHSAAVTESGALYTWGRAAAGGPGSQMPCGLGHADFVNRLVPTLISPQLLGHARVGRWHGLAEDHALAFAMGTHARLGAGVGGVGTGGRRRSRRAQGKAPVEERGQVGCPYVTMPGELLNKVVEACALGPAGGGGRSLGLGGWCG